MNLYTFIQWCFRDGASGLITVMLVWCVFEGLAKIALALRGRG